MKGFETLTDDEIQVLYENLGSFSPAEQAQILAITSELERRNYAKKCQDDLIAFCKHVDPSYIVGAHHRRLATLLTQIALGEKDRIAVSIPPRHGKSHLVSTLFPAWFLGKFPDKKVLMVSHTTDLAVDFGRKVRNLIDSQAYKQIFPNVKLAQDSKSAGRWNTNFGGEYFACIRLHALVHTTNGLVPAGEIKVGDRLLNCGAPVTVKEVYKSRHQKTVRVAGADCSVNHPIWTMNRGWVYAGDVRPDDLLCAETIWDKLWASYERERNGYLGYSDVSPLVQHQESVREPQQRKVRGLRWARDHALRAVAGVREFLSGYGRAAEPGAYSGQGGQQRAVFAGELSVGDTHRTEQQPQEQRGAGRQDVSTARQGAWYYAGSDQVSYGYGFGPAESYEDEEEELRTYDNPEGIGWLRTCATWVFKACSEFAWERQVRADDEGYLARVGRAAQNLCGLLVGVRTAGQVSVMSEQEEDFVNFLTDGDHTYFVDGVLTHNCGVGSNIAGRGADLLLVDDPHSEQDLLSGNFDALEKAYQWFTFGARTRLMSGGRIAIVHTRWHQDDLIGHMVRDGTNNPKADQYEVFEFPAIMEVPHPATGEIVQKALWPEKFDLEALERTKASMPAYQWNAQYMQAPTAEEAALVKREWWVPWEADDPPRCEFIIMTLDAAAEKTNRSDFTALLTWGVFSDDNLTGGAHHIILLNAINERVEFPELKDLAIKEWKYWEPDSFIVEKKSAGTQLYQELRRMGIPVQEFNPSKSTGDKVARINAVADILRSGMVWYPAGRRWAEEVIEQCVAFPYGSHDDMVDCVSMALARFRNGGFITLPSDYKDEPFYPQRRGAAYY